MSQEHIYLWTGQRTDSATSGVGRVRRLAHDVLLSPEQQPFPGRGVGSQSPRLRGRRRHHGLSCVSRLASGFGFESRHPSFAPSRVKASGGGSGRQGVAFSGCQPHSHPADSGESGLLSSSICKLQATPGAPSRWHLSFPVLVKINHALVALCWEWDSMVAHGLRGLQTGLPLRTPR